ncbi:MAG: hypothetical protein HFACDABA_03148 [Anaerolineales bacterium]|nr:hypothetical protein [Anaerolineales bacterium]
MSETTTASPKPSRLAVLSLVFSLILWVMWCLFVLIPVILAEQNLLDETTGYAIFLGGPILLGALTLILGTTGVVLGIQSLRKGDPRRSLAIAGLALNVICLCPFILFALLLLIGGASSLPDFIQQFMQ